MRRCKCGHHKDEHKMIQQLSGRVTWECFVTVNAKRDVFCACLDYQPTPRTRRG